jgi:hypothetical protein
MALAQSTRRREQLSPGHDELGERVQRRDAPAPDLTGSDAQHPVGRLGPSLPVRVDERHPVIETMPGDKRTATLQRGPVGVETDAPQRRAARGRPDQQLAPPTPEIEHALSLLQPHRVKEQRRVRLGQRSVPTHRGMPQAVRDRGFDVDLRRPLAWP